MGLAVREEGGRWLSATFLFSQYWVNAHRTALNIGGWGEQKSPPHPLTTSSSSHQKSRYLIFWGCPICCLQSWGWGLILSLPRALFPNCSSDSLSPGWERPLTVFRSSWLFLSQCCYSDQKPAAHPEFTLTNLTPICATLPGIYPRCIHCMLCDTGRTSQSISAVGAIQVPMMPVSELPFTRLLQSAIKH